MQTLDMTALKLPNGQPIPAFPQNADFMLARFTVPDPISADDALEMDLRETIGGEALATLTSSNGNFVLDPEARTVEVRIKAKDTAAWFTEGDVSEETRDRVIRGTLIHRNSAGASHRWSGLIEIVWPFRIGVTNDRS